MFVLFATPCLSAKVELDFFQSWAQTSPLLASKGISHNIRFQVGICFIDHVRNVLCHTFLHEFPQATDLFFLDDDIGWPPEAVLRLLERDEDIVGGAYPLKQDALGFPVALEGNPDTHTLVERDGLVKAVHLPAGFMRIKRHVIERMAEDQPTYPHRRADGVVDQVKNIFHTGYYDGERWGEDVDFANRWHAMGGSMWLDPDITLSHIGRKRWAGNYSEVLPLVRQGYAEHAK